MGSLTGLGTMQGESIGGFDVLEEIARGGMGVVYRAHDPNLDRTVALKVLPAELSKDEEYRERLLREAKAAARLDHPNVVGVYAAGEDAGRIYFAMQMVAGTTVKEVIQSQGAIDWPEALMVCRGVACGLIAAHGAGIVHRDIKPSNLLISHGSLPESESETVTVPAGIRLSDLLLNDEVKIADFGVARHVKIDSDLTEAGSFVGTPRYAAPEQVEGQKVDGRTDLYSLGVVLYEMLSGKAPFESDSPIVLFKKILNDEPEDITGVVKNIPPAVGGLLRGLLAKAPEDRYATAEEVLELIDAIIDGAPMSDQKEGTPRPRSLSATGARPRAQRPFGHAIPIAMLLLFFGIVGGIAGWYAPSAPDADKPPVVLARDYSIVVFDFDNLAKVDEIDWMTLGIPDLLRAHLTQIERLKFIPREDILKYLPDGMTDPREQLETARRLGADLVLRGKVIGAGTDVVVILSLLGPDGRDEWTSEKIRGTQDTVIDMVETLAARLMEGFQGTIGRRLMDQQVTPTAAPTMVTMVTRAKESTTSSHSMAPVVVALPQVNLKKQMRMNYAAGKGWFGYQGDTKRPYVGRDVTKPFRKKDRARLIQPEMDLREGQRRRIEKKNHEGEKSVKFLEALEEDEGVEEEADQDKPASKPEKMDKVLDFSPSGGVKAYGVVPPSPKADPIRHLAIRFFFKGKQAYERKRWKKALDLLQKSYDLGCPDAAPLLEKLIESMPDDN